MLAAVTPVSVLSMYANIHVYMENLLPGVSEKGTLEGKGQPNDYIDVCLRTGI